MQETMSEHSDHNIDFELDAQYESEMPDIKRGVKLSKSDEQWSTANLFFLNALPISGINSSKLNDSIQILNFTIYTYFEKNFGYSDEVCNEELIKKYKDMPKRSFKTNLKVLKQAQASPLEIKYVSRLLGNKLRNTTDKLSSEIAHNEQLKKKFWGYVKANLKHSSSLSPSFDIEACRTFFQDFFRSSNSSKLFTIPDWIPSLSTTVVPYNLSPPSYQQITKIVRRMKASGSPCPLDKISILPFKRCPYLRSYITEVICLVLISGNVPDEWKMGCTVLMHKKGDTSDPSNFRPITLESVPLKIFTSCLRDSMFSCLSSNDYIEHKIQKSFLPKLTGTFEHTAQMSNIINKAWIKQRSLVITLLDLKNAFGEVHDNLIPEVLRYHHIPQHIQNMVHSLYCNFHTSIITTSYQTPFLKVGKAFFKAIASAF